MTYVFYKNATLKKFAIFTVKRPVLECLFNKAAGHQACLLIYFY